LFSCKGVKYGFKGTTIHPDAKTISVLYFQNNSTMANPVEAQKFTEKLRDMVSAQTNLALSKQNGDLQFEGYIADYTVAPIAIQSTDQAALNRLTVTIHVKYSSKLEPAKNFEQNFARFYDYAASKTLTAVETEALEEINRQISEDVFQRAFNNW
jgi:Lipopolysaccharide-assembly